MTLQEAKLEILKNQHLIGEVIDDGEVTHIVIVPTDNDIFTDIVEDIIMGYDYQYRLINSKDFDIYVLFDMYNANEGYYSHLPLHTALGRRQ